VFTLLWIVVLIKQMFETKISNKRLKFKKKPAIG
jgi:hypothetical protein